MIETKFKNSDVGLIPEDWDVMPLGEVCIFQNGFAFKSEKFSKYGNPIIRISNIRDGEIDDSNMVYFINSDYNDNLEPYVIKKNCIIIAMSGATTGKVGINRSDIKYYMNQRVGMFLPMNKLNNFYLYHILHSQTSSLYHLAEGCAQPNISSKAIKEYLLKVPKNTLEQSRIATALSDVDDLITTTKKLIEKKRNIKEGAMQELLSGKRRLPGFKEKWVEKELGEIADLYQPQTIGANLFADFGYPVYGANGAIGYYHSYNHETDQVMITCRGSSCGEVNYSTGKSWINGNAMVVNMDDYEVCKKFIFYYLKYQDFSDTISGSGQPQITRKPLQEYCIYIPSDTNEQQAIANVFSDMDSEIQSLEARLTKYQSLKQGMMQQLLTGKIRLI